MLSGNLVHLIESHWDQIVARVVEQIRREPGITHVRAVIEGDLRDWAQALLQNLGSWLTAGKEEDLAHKFEKLGKIRFEEGVPLHESVRCLCIVREKMLEYVEDQIFTKSHLELYAEEELERRLGRFFDFLTFHLVRGYERELRKAAALAAV